MLLICKRLNTRLRDMHKQIYKYNNNNNNNDDDDDDNLTMGDRQPAVAADVKRVKEIGENRGLTLNVKSSVILTHPLPIHCCCLSRVVVLTKPLFSALHFSSGLSWMMRDRRDWLI